MSEAKAGPSPEIRALLDQAVAHHREGRLDEAAEFYRRVLAIDAEEPNALTNLGTVALQQGRLAEGVELIERSLKVRPDQSNAINNRGNALLTLKRHEEALAAFDRAVEIDPANAEAHSNRGVALAALGRREEAVGAYRQAVALKPQFLDALNGLGISLQELGRAAEALEVYDQALTAAPQTWELHYNRGNALRALNRPDEALAAYDRGAAMAPANAGALANRAVTLQALGRVDEALADLERAIALDPQHLDAQWNKALVLLLKGDYAAGWRQYEWRWKQRQFREGPQPPGGPAWTSKVPLDGLRLLMVCEQGFGDTIQMLRYARLAAEQGAKVSALVQPPLVELARSAPGVSQVAAEGDPLPPYDMWIAMMSLPLGFGTTLDTVPAQVPYLTAPEAAQAKWAAALGERRRPRVGLVWSGRATHGNDANRTMAMETLKPLLAGHADVISLQTEYREADRPQLAELGIRDVSGELKSFGDTAGLIANLDLVVSVDTSVAHLAGALGKPLLVMLPFAPDFRWGLEGETTPWYPTAKLLRQETRGDWRPVIARAAAEIAALKA